MWDIDPWDWKLPGTQAIIDQILGQAHPGAIVLMHDGGGNRGQTLASLATILHELDAAGYRFEAYCR